jgi:hypothetical protein
MANGIHMHSKIGSLPWKIYLKWIGLSSSRKMRFVKMKLKGQARVWWQREEEYLHQFHLPPISDYKEMKFKLQEKYTQP